ncbi:MAG: amidohydrolase family protein, partial [Gemmatimonadota bacterium]|nr:amidohydrolase family protein [Gemmatimonadota bacterium]
MRTRVSARLALALCSLAAASHSAHAQDADFMVRNARIWTGDSARPYAQAVAVRGDRIVGVGTSASMARHRAAHTRVVDAGGRFVAPGFIDNHTHFERAGALILGVNLLDVADEAALIRRVREARARLPRGAWLVGGEWGAYATDTARVFRPHRAMVDSITPETPALLSKWDRSVYLANGRALQLAGVACDWEGVECAGGQPTGRLTPAAAERVRR